MSAPHTAHYAPPAAPSTRSRVRPLAMALGVAAIASAGAAAIVLYATPCHESQYCLLLALPARRAVMALRSTARAGVCAWHRLRLSMLHAHMRWLEVDAHCWRTELAYADDLDAQDRAWIETELLLMAQEQRDLRTQIRATERRIFTLHKWAQP